MIELPRVQLPLIQQLEKVVKSPLHIVVMSGIVVLIEHMYVIQINLQVEYGWTILDDLVV